MGHVCGLLNRCGFLNICRLDSSEGKCLLSRAPINAVRCFKTAILRKTRWRSQSSGPKPRIGPLNTEFEGVKVENGGPVQFSKLFKPLCFTFVISSGSFVCATIWQYENVRARAILLLKKPGGWDHGNLFVVKKHGTWRNHVNTWWNSLTEGQRLFFPICFVNCLVFLAWRVPRLQGIMVQYFCSNPASRAVCWPMVLSTFSHYSAIHLLANMFVLHSFLSGAVASLGKEQFLGLYMSAGVISSMSSYFHKSLIKKPGFSLGASGAIMCLLGYVCTEYPETKLTIIFLPLFTFPAAAAIKVIMAVDAAGVLLGWKFFDHAAHLGGAACGIAWSYWGNACIWQKREPLLHWWHKLRGGSVK